MNSTFKFSFTKSDLDKIYWRFTSNDTRYEVKENSKEQVNEEKVEE